MVARCRCVLSSGGSLRSRRPCRGSIRGAPHGVEPPTRCASGPPGRWSVTAEMYNIVYRCLLAYQALRSRLAKEHVDCWAAVPPEVREWRRQLEVVQRARG
jgi:hypothetical protein